MISHSRDNYYAVFRNFLWFIGGTIMFVGIVMSITFGRRDNEDNSFEQLKGSLALVVFWGLGAALYQAIGLVALKPAIASGADPLAVSAYRTIASALLIVSLGLIPSFRFKGVDIKSLSILMQCILAGWMGYVLAMSLLLFSLRYYNTGIVAVIASTVPIILLPIMRIKTGICPSIPAWIGAGLVVVGSTVIVF